jgi:hypothetical protein
MLAWLGHARGQGGGREGQMGAGTGVGGFLAAWAQGIGCFWRRRHAAAAVLAGTRGGKGELGRFGLAAWAGPRLSAWWAGGRARLVGRTDG